MNMDFYASYCLTKGCSNIPLGPYWCEECNQARQKALEELEELKDRKLKYMRVAKACDDAWEKRDQ
jgi:hypothetical protein